MRDPVEVRTDVSDVANLAAPVHTAVSVFAPDAESVASPPVVAFGFPGAGYSRGYYFFDMPGASYRGQAGYHVQKDGWIFVACDHLGVGESITPDPSKLTFETVAAANRKTVQTVLASLETGSLMPDLPPIRKPVRLGIGQSMGGCFTIFLQGTDPVFDAAAILGFSAIHTVLPVPKDQRPAFDRDRTLVNDSVAREAAFRYAFHHADVPTAIVEMDVVDYPARRGTVPLWGSSTVPGCVDRMPMPGVVSKEAAAIDVPVFVGVGEIDVVPDPRAEASAYSSAPDISVVISPRMAHMHNFAGNRMVLWDRIASWASGLRPLDHAR